ncbi:MAG: hypothetical protein JNK30_01620 [Phenylobacterium sp.]|uniref:hypothetical protein n=1 Tax=Phenylobacterium sp. TaxID=1871053 RepID=UPI001A4F5CB6|nr:hypothetical protein [Phenylobacterium sp.]MBL8770054.1 hypothetical protein [Phenylobacterium sp.]
MRQTLLTGAAALVVLGPATVARAQSAYEINRLNAAIQICNSPAGATMAECAQLRAKLGSTTPASPGLPGGGLGGLVGGNKAAVASGVLGLLNQARVPAPAAPAPAVNGAAIQDAIRMCVQNAAGDSTAIQACLRIAGAAAPAPAAPSPPRLGIGAYQAPGLPAAPGGATGLNNGDVAAMGIYRAGQSYQACAAANPSNWQSCLPLLNGGSPPR